MQSQTEEQSGGGGSNINGTLSALGVPPVLDGQSTGRHGDIQSRPENNHRLSSGASASQDNILFHLLTLFIFGSKRRSISFFFLHNVYRGGKNGFWTPRAVVRCWILQRIGLKSASAVYFSAWTFMLHVHCLVQLTTGWSECSWTRTCKNVFINFVSFTIKQTLKLKHTNKISMANISWQNWDRGVQKLSSTTVF